MEDYHYCFIPLERHYVYHSLKSLHAFTENIVTNLRHKLLVFPKVIKKSISSNLNNLNFHIGISLPVHPPYPSIEHGCSMEKSSNDPEESQELCWILKLLM